MVFMAPRVPRRARAGRSASVRRSARCADFPAMLAAVARRTTRCVRCALSAQTSATSQTTKRAARAATATALLGASRGALRPAHAGLGQQDVGSLPVESHFISCCGRRCPVGAISGAAVTASLGPGAPVRASFLTRGHCLSGESVSERSEFGRAGPRLVGAAESAHRADRPGMSPRRTAPAAAARCNERHRSFSDRASRQTMKRRERAAPPRQATDWRGKRCGP